MYQHILVAVDDSKTSNRALREAIYLAKNQHAKLRIVYAIDESIIYGDAMISDPAEIEKAWIKIGNNILMKAQDLARQEGLNVETRLLQTRNVDHHVADAIMAEVKAWPADLLVAGTHGRTGLKHLMLGSVAEGLLRATSIPILLVRAS